MDPMTDRRSDGEDGVQTLSGYLGRTVQQLRRAGSLSLSDLAARSGVAKSIISQIERAETNPTLATLWRLSQALEVPIERLLVETQDEPFIEKSTRADTPLMLSADGKCQLAAIGWIKTVDWLQWYDFRAEPGGVLESAPHQRGSVEHLSILMGEVEVEVGGVIERARPGETLRYRCDRFHAIRAIGTVPVRATMICFMRPGGTEQPL